MVSIYFALMAGLTSFCHLAHTGQPTEAYSTTVILAWALPRSMSSGRAPAAPPVLGEQAAKLSTASADRSATLIRNILNLPLQGSPPEPQTLGGECDRSLAAKKASGRRFAPLKARRSYLVN